MVRALASVLIGVVVAALPIILLGVLRLEGRPAFASTLLIIPGALLVLSLGLHPGADAKFMVAAVIASALLYTTATWLVLIAVPGLVGRMMRDSDPDR